MVMHDASHRPVEDNDLDIDFDTSSWDKSVASDFPTLRDALRAAQRVSPKKRVDFWRDNPWGKKKPAKGKSDGEQGKRRVAKKAPPKPDASTANAPRPTETPTPTLEPVGPPLKPDRAAMRAHLEFLAAPARDPDPTKYPEPLVEIAFDHGGDGDPNRAQLFDITPAGLDAAAEFTAYVNGNALRCNVYVGVCLKKLKTPRGHRINGGDSCIMTAMAVDIDHDAEESNARLAAIATPGLTVTTGTIPELRQQKWCALAKPCADMPLVKHAFETVVETIGGDTNATGLNRLMRLAGSVSRPCPKKQARGYVPELTTLSVDPNAPPVGIETFAALAPRDQPREPREPRSPRPDNPNGGVDSVPLGLSLDDLKALVMDIPNDGGDDNSPDYDDWLRVGAGIHHETRGSQAGFELFDEWSARHPTYDAKKTLKTYESFDKSYIGARATAATIVYIARQTGSSWYPNDPIDDEAVATPEAEPAEVETPAPDHGAETAKADAPKPNPEQAAGPEPPIGEARNAKQEQEQTKARSDRPNTATPPASVFDPWEQFIVPPLPMEVFEDIPRLRDFAIVMAESFGCDPAALAMSALTTLGITHETKLVMNGEDDSFKVSVCLWVLLVAASGEMKTPIFNAVVEALLKLEREEFAAYQKQHDEWEAADEPRGPEPLAPSPLVHNDCTIEALGMELAKDPRGALTLRDEMPGWLGSMERYGGAGSAAADRAAWLQARTGGSHRVGRVTRKGGLIANLSSSLLGGVQPQKLAEIKGLTSDGLLQRFIPVMQHRGRFGNRHIDTRAARAGYERLVRECHAVPATYVSLSPEAADAMWELREYLHNLANALSGSSDAMANFVSKLAGVAGNLTLIIHIAAHPDKVYRPVERRAVECVSRLIHEYILPHAMEFYRVIGVSWNGEQLRKIASYILTSGKDTFTASDFTRNVAPLVGKEVPEVVRAVSPLAAVGWLDLDNRKPTAPRWKLCPGVAEAMATRRETEEREKQALAELMNSNRRGRGRE
jgi:hypothetical protein